MFEQKKESGKNKQEHFWRRLKNSRPSICLCNLGDFHFAFQRVYEIKRDASKSSRRPPERSGPSPGICNENQFFFFMIIEFEFFMWSTPTGKAEMSLADLISPNFCPDCGCELKRTIFQ